MEEVAGTLKALRILPGRQRPLGQQLTHRAATRFTRQLRLFQRNVDIRLPLILRCFGKHAQVMEEQRVIA